MSVSTANNFFLFSINKVSSVIFFANHGMKRIV
jgi:hypothetical protein